MMKESNQLIPVLQSITTRTSIIINPSTRVQAHLIHKKEATSTKNIRPYRGNSSLRRSIIKAEVNISIIITQRSIMIMRMMMSSIINTKSMRQLMRR